MRHRPSLPAGRRLPAAPAWGLVTVTLWLALAAAAEAASLPTPALAPAAPDQSWLILSVAPGGRWDGVVVLTNTAPVARRIRLYAVDASILKDGAFAPGSARGRRAAGRWMRPGRTLVALGAGERVRVPVSVRVPRRVCPGTYLGALVAEDALPEARDGVSVASRGALRVYLTVTSRGNGHRGRPRRCPA